MYASMNFAFEFDRTLLKMSLYAVRSDVGVVTSPGRLIRLPPAVSWVRFVSDFCGRISTTVIP